MTDIRQTPEYAKFMGSTGWRVEKIDSAYLYIKKFPVIGSFAKLQRPEKISIKDLEKVVKKHKIFHIVTEPKDDKQVAQISKLGFKLSRSPYLPSKTLLLDLTRIKSKLFKDLSKDARYSLRRNAETKIHEEKSLEKFRKNWKSAVTYKRYVMPLKDLKALKRAFKNNLILLKTHNDNSGGIFIKTEKTAYYWQGFANKEGRKDLSQYKVVWEGILWSKRKGAKQFDFEGIYDERFRTKSWIGFSAFKKKFGGTQKLYPGAYRKYYLKNIWGGD